MFLICAQFLLGLLAHSPDLSLDELKEELWHRHRISVSLSTLCMTLKELDLPRKQVRHTCLCIFCHFCGIHTTF